MHSLTDEKCILDQYSDVFTGLGCAEGEYTIQLAESLHSYSTEAKCKTLANMSVISCADGITMITDRVNNLVIIEKLVKNGSLMLCLDPPDLNHAIKCEFN